MSIVIFLVFSILLLVFRSWFSFSNTLSSGDWPYLYKETIAEFSFLPQLNFLWLAPYYQILTKVLVEYLGISWEIVERLFWFWPFLVLTIFSSYYLTKSWIGVLIYTTNTYILMLVGGGQMGIAMAYAIAPFMLKKFVNFSNYYFSSGGQNRNVIFNKKIFSGSIILGLIFSILTMFDPRITYILTIAFAAYALLNIFNKKINFLYTARFAIIGLIIPLVIAGLLNSYWIIPFISGNLPQKYEGLGNIAGFDYLSFADFSHAFSLLHPNWPENIFGKVYFLQSQFLMLPLIAFLSLLFTSYSDIKKEKKILYFSALSIFGIFLAKGTNAPFGEINLWIFEHIPGMTIFRDASKFYLLIALSYAFLIPISLEKISKKIPLGKFLPIIFILFWCVLIRHAILGELGGTFKTRVVPLEYIELKKYIISQPKSAILWLPSRQRFGFSSNLHVGISMSDILKSSDILAMAKVVSNNSDKNFYNKLKKMKVEKVIVPYDSEKELFILDRKYNDLLRDKVVMELDKTEWLVRLPEFSPIAVYRVR